MMGSFRCFFLYLILGHKLGEGFFPSWSLSPRVFVKQSNLLLHTSVDDNSKDILESLKARQKEINYENFILEQKWRNADCSSQIQANTNDWVRRLDVSEYPIAACGSASGRIHVMNLETGEMLAETSTTETDNENSLQSADTCIEVERVRHLLHYGSGRVGTVAIAFSGDLICVSNPMDNSSGVNVYRFDVDSKQLISQGIMKSLEGVIVSCLVLDEAFLWVGTTDGHVYAYSCAEDSEVSLPLTLQTAPEMQWNFTGTILSISLHQTEIGHGVVTTASGSVELINLEGEDGNVVCSLYPPLNGKERVMTAILAQTRCEDENSYAIICGGGDGSIWTQPLKVDQYGEVCEEQPFQDPLIQIRPPHLGPVKCLASPIPGLLVSGGLDGSLRVWDIEEGSSLYQFVGYKIWMGSIWTDGSRLVTDGSDNSVIVHDFLHEDNDSDL